MKAREITWQGPAGRTPDRFLVVRIEDIARDRGGLFGILRSPSIVGALPDARIVRASLMDGSAPPAEVRVRLPGGELPALATGDRAVLGLIGEHVCLCILAPPAELAAEAIDGWAAAQPCGH